MARRWLLALIACAVLVPLSIAYVDRPVALFVNQTLGAIAFTLVRWRVPEAVGLLLAGTLLAVVFRLAYGRRGRYERLLFLAAAAFAMSETIKAPLKYLAGRTWPVNYYQSGPTLIGNGAFGFTPLHGGYGWTSFPSGHMMFATSVAVIPWLYAPRWRPVIVGVVGGLAVVLVGFDFHFVADVIAGTFVGAACGWLTVLVTSRVWGDPMGEMRR